MDPYLYEEKMDKFKFYRSIKTLDLMDTFSLSGSYHHCILRLETVVISCEIAWF